ncbi:hypothetical protein NI18_07210 [Sphingomonas sp. Ant20]|nr:hypothetical protein NI18_07210 [Sphingomonas sp. Ant20]
MLGHVKTMKDCGDRARDQTGIAQIHGPHARGTEMRDDGIEMTKSLFADTENIDDRRDNSIAQASKSCANSPSALAGLRAKQKSSRLFQQMRDRR